MYCRGGGKLQFSYVITLGGGSFDTPHFSENPRPPLGRNKRTVPNNFKLFSVSRV